MSVCIDNILPSLLKNYGICSDVKKSLALEKPMSRSSQLQPLKLEEESASSVFSAQEALDLTLSTVCSSIELVQILTHLSSPLLRSLQISGQISILPYNFEKRLHRDVFSSIGFSF